MNTQRPVHPRGAEVSAMLADAAGSSICAIPALTIDVEHPTTIGLGDTFVGGFIAALAREGTAGD